jgi:hypothetical protein
MVLAISFLEAPLKFRAPGITIPLGLGIGRLVFRALNAIELLLAVLLVIAAATATVPTAAWVLIVGVSVLLVLQVFVLRPLLDRRATVILAGGTPARSHQHVLYIGLEVIKVVALPVLGVVLATDFLP